MPFLWERPPPLVGHRGSPREAPENTMAGFRASIAAGVRAVELDARLTADGEIVVHHDAHLGRTARGEGLLEAMPYAEIAELDAGSWFAPAFAAERIPRLADVFAQLPEDVLVNVEIKPDADNAHDAPARVADIVRKAGALERVLVTSFEPELADAYARIMGRPAGYLMPWAPEPGELDAWPRLGFLALAEDAVVEESVRLAKDAGRQVLVWTVNEAEAAGALLRLGAASIITDRPGPLRAHLSGGAPAGSSPPASAP